MAAAFRPSRFIDFDNGLVHIVPNELYGRYRNGMGLPEKIELFECIVEVWQLGVAVAILNRIEREPPPSIWCHSAFGLLSVMLSYFETIGKSLNPNPKSKAFGKAGTDFNWGFCDVYPRYKPADGRYDDKSAGTASGIATVVEFRNRLRNGMYHVGFIKKGLIIHNSDDICKDDFGVDVRRRMYAVNPHRVARTLVDHFPGFIERLKDSDPEHDGLRKRFELFFHEVYVT